MSWQTDENNPTVGTYRDLESGVVEYHRSDARADTAKLSGSAVLWTL